jgi:hypothetical protein
MVTTTDHAAEAARSRELFDVLGVSVVIFDRRSSTHPVVFCSAPGTAELGRISRLDEVLGRLPDVATVLLDAVEHAESPVRLTTTALGGRDLLVQPLEADLLETVALLIGPVGALR